MSKTTKELEQDYKDAVTAHDAADDVYYSAYNDAEAAWGVRAARARARAAAHDSAYAAFKLWQNRLKEEELDERP